MDSGGTAATSSRKSSPLWLQILRILFFRAGQDELGNFGYKHLTVGLVCTWIVGMGRYWDDACAYPMQHLGLASVFYVFFLAFLLWLVILPLKPSGWSYRQVLTYITLTSPPAIIYAIPVEKFLSMQDATNANLYFLIFVALWRVALMAQYLRLVARLPFLFRTVGMLFPVTSVISLLFLFDQHRAVFEVMGGFRHHLGPREGADVFLDEVVGCSAVFCPLAAIGYIVMIFIAQRRVLSTLVRQHKLLVSILSFCLIAGTAYGIGRFFYKSPSDLLCDTENSVDGPEKKIALYDRALALDPKNTRALASRAWWEKMDGRYAEALADYNKAISIAPGNSEYLSSRAFLFQELGRFDDCLADEHAGRNISTATLVLGSNLQAFNVHGFESLKDLPRLLSSNSSWRSRRELIWEQFCNLAFMRMPQWSIDKANTRSLTEDIPKLWQLGRLDEALEDCNSVLNRAQLAHGSAPTSSQHDNFAEDTALASAYRLRGYTYELSSQNAKALTDYELALASVKDDQQSLFLKARLLKKLGRNSEARDTFLLCKSAIANCDLGEPSKYMELLVLADLGEIKEAASRLTSDPRTKDVVHVNGENATPGELPSGEHLPDDRAVQLGPALQTHAGGIWSGYLDEDCAVPAKLWETGKFYELLDMNVLARQRFLSAIAWMDKHGPKQKHALEFFLWRTKLFLSLGDKGKAAEAFKRACSLGYGGEMPRDDMSSIDVNLLVSHQFRP